MDTYLCTGWVCRFAQGLPPVWARSCKRRMLRQPPLSSLVLRIGGCREDARRGSRLQCQRGKWEEESDGSSGHCAARCQIRIFSHVAETPLFPSPARSGGNGNLSALRIPANTGTTFTQTVGCCTEVISSIQRDFPTSGFVAITC